jgi:hypothetical protein
VLTSSARLAPGRSSARRRRPHASIPSSRLRGWPSSKRFSDREEDLGRANELDPSAYISKPLNVDDLDAVLARWDAADAVAARGLPA